MINIAFDKQNIQRIIVTIQKIVGAILVKLFVDLRNPFETIPKKIAENKYTNAEKLLTKNIMII